MKLPRSVSGKDLAARLGRYGYTVTRQAGSHIRLTSNVQGNEHHITIPAHDPLRVGTLNSILSSVAEYLKKNRQQLMNELF